MKLTKIIDKKAHWIENSQKRVQTLVLDDITNGKTIVTLATYALVIICLLILVFNVRALQLIAILISNNVQIPSYHHMVGSYLLMIIIPFIAIIMASEETIKDRTQKNIRALLPMITRAEYITARYLGMIIKIATLYTIGIITITLYSLFVTKIAFISTSITIFTQNIIISIFLASVALLIAIHTNNAAAWTGVFFIINGIFLDLGPLDKISFFTHCNAAIAPLSTLYMISGALLLLLISYFTFKIKSL